MFWIHAARTWSEHPFRFEGERWLASLARRRRLIAYSQPLHTQAGLARPASATRA